MDELVDGGDKLPDVAEHEQPHDAQRDARQPVGRRIKVSKIIVRHQHSAEFCSYIE